MFYSGLLTEGGRKETDLREAASLRQQRRMKQAVQFMHKDSADLLPLDGLKKLGSSKDTVSALRAWGPRARPSPIAAFPESPPGPPLPSDSLLLGFLSIHPSPAPGRSGSRLRPGSARSPRVCSSRRDPALPPGPGGLPVALSAGGCGSRGAGACSQGSPAGAWPVSEPDTGDSSWAWGGDGVGRGFLGSHHAGRLLWTPSYPDAKSSPFAFGLTYL